MNQPKPWLVPDPWEVEADTERRRAYQRDYRARNRERINAYRRAWSAKQRERRWANAIGALHDLSCRMPERCTCRNAIPVYRP